MNLPGKTILSVVKMFKERKYVRIIADSNNISKEQAWEIIRAYCENPDKLYAKAQGKSWPPSPVSAFHGRKAAERVIRYDPRHYRDVAGPERDPGRMVRIDYR